jgi:hypothetical protein
VCTSGQPDNPCVDKNAACQLESGTYKCVCKSQYYENNAEVCAGSKFECFETRIYCNVDQTPWYMVYEPLFSKG